MSVSNSFAWSWTAIQGISQAFINFFMEYLSKFILSSKLFIVSYNFLKLSSASSSFVAFTI